jgi:ECF transporter S component (folate family)
LQDFIKDFFNPRGVFTTRNLVLMALMVTLSTILTAVEVYVAPMQKLFAFDYLPRAIAAILFGPWAALTVAFVSDFTSFLIQPQYGYFIGYALSAMTADFLCALLLYKRKISVWRVVLWRILVLAIVVFGLNGIWNTAFFGVAAGKYFTGFRLLRNLMQMPLDVFLVTLFGRIARKFISGAWQ